MVGLPPYAGLRRGALFDMSNGRRAPPASSENRRDGDFAEPDFAVIALQHDRPGGSFVAVERAAGDAFDDGVVLHGLAVEQDGDAIADNRRLNGLPFARRAAGVDLGR